VGRVLRGGSWINNGRNARSANRNRNEPDNRNNNTGFRLALALRTAQAALDQAAFQPAALRRQKVRCFPCASVGPAPKARRGGPCFQPSSPNPMSPQRHPHLPADFPAAWACAYGEDEFGLWMALDVSGIEQVFRWIAPGVFRMGSPEGEPERWAERETQHEVTLTRGYWLADSACTQALWQAVTSSNPSEFKNDPNNPVETVSWNDAQAFIARLNEQVPSPQARLPSEAEWEYACRAGTTTPFSFGANITPEQVNYDGNHPYAGGAKGEYRKKTVPVKSLPPNPWGLYEMHGNVWEWCQDWFGDYDPGPQQDPAGPLEGQYRVLRGGSWFGNGWSARSAYRRWDGPDDRISGTGFRLALGPTGRQEPPA